jgi:hypothetical protein
VGYALNVVIIAAFLAGCGAGAQRQYQTAINNEASLECRALQAVPYAPLFISDYGPAKRNCHIARTVKTKIAAIVPIASSGR